MTDTNHIEDQFVAECRRQGHQPNDKIMRELAVTIAGSAMNAQNLIVLPGKGSLSLSDLVRSLRAAMPEGFQVLDDKPETGAAGNNLTATMMREIAATRRKRPLPADWREVRSRYGADTITGRMLAQREAEWK